MISLEVLREYRIGPFTIFDTVISYLGILILSPLFTWLAAKIHLNISIVSWLWLTIPLSVFFHLVSRQETPLMKILSDPSKYEFYIALVVIVFMTYMGLKNVTNIELV